MHIKQVTIQGFKTYKDQTIIGEFDEHHNVVVGRNGTGKSNFFAAIRFVLGDMYTSLDKDERQRLLHEGAGTVMSAYVEIVFDNRDNRLPVLYEGRERKGEGDGGPGRDVVIRRTIGLKKDEYQLNGRSITKTDLMNMLESAGFSKANPYYIVAQGRVTTLTNAKDSDRLQLLKEVAGTQVYEDRRKESIKIMEETKIKRKEIKELLENIENRLKELQSEKDELQRYQELDRKRRCLQYAISTNEKNEYETRLRLLEINKEEFQAISNQFLDESLETEKQLRNLENEIQNYQVELDELNEKKNRVDEEREEHVKLVSQTELVVNDWRDRLASGSETMKRAQAELKVLKERIAEKDNNLKTRVKPAYDTEVEKEKNLQKLLLNMETRKYAVVSRLGRSGRFTTQKERDDWLAKEIESVESSLKTMNLQKDSLLSDMSRIEAEIAEIEATKKRNNENITNRKSREEETKKQGTVLTREKEALLEKRKELWRKQGDAEAEDKRFRSEYEKLSNMLKSQTNNDLRVGLDKIVNIAKQLNLPGYYGILYELFDCDNTIRTAVEVTAGNSLFNIVVDNDGTATILLEQLNRERAGRVTFMPLNRIMIKPVHYPSETNVAFPLISKLKFDERFRSAMEQVFNKFLVCRDLNVATEMARAHKLNCVTLQGDEVNRKGAFTGGYREPNKSRMHTIGLLKAASLGMRNSAEIVKNLKDELARLDAEIQSKLSELQRNENAYSEIVKGRDFLLKNISEGQKSLEEKTDSKTKMNMSLKSIENSINIATTQLEELKSELQKPLTAKSAADEEELKALTKELENLQPQLMIASENRQKLEETLKSLQHELKTDLLRRQEELKQEVARHSSNEVSEVLKQKELELQAVNRRMEEIQALKKHLEDNIERNTQRMSQLQSKVEEQKVELVKQQEKLQEQTLKREKSQNQRDLLQIKLDECTRKIRELGSLPMDLYETYKNVRNDKLTSELHKVNEELKKYSHVNKKAFEQYVNFTAQRDDFISRQEDLNESQIAIENLIHALDMKKDEAINRTFNQVGKNFEKIFSQLVPNGHGKIVMIRRADDPSSSSQPDQPSSGIRSKIDQYTGVGIQVSFTSKTGDVQKLSQLSGGQKSLVALVLIFAIQECDPAPFYLFDEIDAHLDAIYARAVADKVHELSANAQFITTTFRPELLQRCNKCFGVTFANKVSHIQEVTREEALNFIETEKAK